LTATQTGSNFKYSLDCSPGEYLETMDEIFNQVVFPLSKRIGVLDSDNGVNVVGFKSYEINDSHLPLAEETFKNLFRMKGWI
jgi:hypothetical protein